VVDWIWGILRKPQEPIARIELPFIKTGRLIQRRIRTNNFQEKKKTGRLCRKNEEKT
jgi:hypothetical protein